MKIAFIYPFDRNLGTSYYSESYIQALKNHVEIIAIDSLACTRSPKAAALLANNCDLTHVQYEPNFFQLNNRNGYERFVKLLTVPRIVSLHEVYRTQPNIFPREDVRGNALIKPLKLMWYDIRHPLHTIFRNHRHRGFFASRIIVHYPYQKSIVSTWGIAPDTITVIAYPLQPRTPISKPSAAALRLGCSGFINLNYDYDLLFETLAGIQTPWTFVWIGGLRRREDQWLLDKINRRISDYNWQDRFTITGWIDDESIYTHLERLDCFLALFSERSSSGTILRILETSCPVVATRLPMTVDINAECTVLELIDREPKQALAAINRLCHDLRYRQERIQAVHTYGSTHSFLAMADKLFAVYQSMV